MNPILFFGKAWQWVKIKLYKDANGSFLPRLKMKFKPVFLATLHTLLKKADKFENEIRSEDIIYISVKQAIPHYLINNQKLAVPTKAIF